MQFSLIWKDDQTIGCAICEIRKRLCLAGLSQTYYRIAGREMKGNFYVPQNLHIHVLLT